MKKGKNVSSPDKDGRRAPLILTRRNFFRLSASAFTAVALGPQLSGQEKVAESKPQPSTPPPDIPTNIAEIRNIPRTKDSLPGRYPGKVIKIAAETASSGGEISAARISDSITRGMLELTGEKDLGSAFRQFVSPADIVGIKVNPIGGKLLSTRPEVADVIIDGLCRAGIPKKNIVIWDRRLFQLHEAGFTPERFPGIEILGTEMRGPNGDFFDENGELWSRENIDREAPFYYADIEGKYDKKTLPYMVNEGKESYFSKIVTRRLTKIINVPVLKNAGPTVTLCLKNLSYGSLSNTSRLHKLWNKSVAEPCAFPALRDKVVLNIADGLRACYDGGPGADARFIWDAKLILIGTDPVAVDAVAHDFIVQERIKRGVQQIDDRRRRAYLDLAAELGLGVAEKDKILVKEVGEVA